MWGREGSHWVERPQCARALTVPITASLSVFWGKIRTVWSDGSCYSKSVSIPREGQDSVVKTGCSCSCWSGLLAQTQIVVHCLQVWSRPATADGADAASTQREMVLSSELCMCLLGFKRALRWTETLSRSLFKIKTSWLFFGYECWQWIRKDDSQSGDSAQWLRLESGRHSVERRWHPANWL